MRRAAIAAAAIAAVSAFGFVAEAQAQPLRLNVRPRSWLDPGNTVQPYSQVNPTSPLGQEVSYLRNPPYQNFKDRFGEGTLPDPVNNGPFVGNNNYYGTYDSENPFRF